MAIKCFFWGNNWQRFNSWLAKVVSASSGFFQESQETQNPTSICQLLFLRSFQIFSDWLINFPSPEPQSNWNKQQIPTDNKIKRSTNLSISKKIKSENKVIKSNNIKFYCYSNFPKKKENFAPFLPGLSVKQIFPHLDPQKILLAFLFVIDLMLLC
jgi:hypothetical protein